MLEPVPAALASHLYPVMSEKACGPRPLHVLITLMRDTGQGEQNTVADPRSFCPERNFLAGGCNRRLIELPAAKRPDVLSAAAAEHPGAVVMIRATRHVTTPISVRPGIHLIDWPATDLEDYRSCAAIAASLPAPAPVLLIIDDLLQRLADPRPLLATVREMLLATPGAKCLISTPARTPAYDRDPDAARLWTEDEFSIAMQAAGFSAARAQIKAADDPSGMMIWQLACETGSYLDQLSRAGLPPPAAKLVLDPHPAHAMSAEALTLVTNDAQTIAAPNMHVRAFGESTGPDTVLAAMLQILFIYPGIRVIEICDHQGIGYRVAQARRAGMLPPATRVVMHACENALTLNATLRAFDRDRPARIAAMERLSIDLADIAVFPDAQRRALYVEHGGMVPRAACMGTAAGWEEPLEGMADPDPSPSPPGGVTVLMTSFNAKPEHIADAAQGLCNAYRRPEKLIFVDDHSTPAGSPALAALQPETLNGLPVEFLRLPENLGPAGARNAGLARVTTPYVCGHDHDNIMLNRFLSVACRILDENPQVAAVTSWMAFFEDGGDWRFAPDQAHDYRPLGADLGVALTDNIVGDHFAVYRTSVLREIGGWDASGRAVWEDWQLFCRLMAAGFTIWTVPEVLTLYRLRPDSRNATQSHFEGWLSLTRAFPGLPRGQAVSLMQAAWHMAPGASAPVQAAPPEPPLPVETPAPEPDGLAAELEHLRLENAALRAIEASTAWRYLRWLLMRLERLPMLLTVLRLIAARRRPALPNAAPVVTAPEPANPPPPAASEAAPMTARIAGPEVAPESLRAIARSLKAPASLTAASPAWRPRVSVIVPTDRRPASLDNLLSCLRYQEGPDFEVIVVAGPSGMGTGAVLEKWSGAIKLARTNVQNTSQSRNLGIAMAAGDVIALIDDDALPEADWLLKLTAAFSDPGVGAVGGAEYDHTGMARSLPYISVDRLGTMDMSWTAPVEAFNFPLSFHIPFTRGANSAFRHAALREVGGFDEEYEYYYDETDLCCRLLDAGWQLRQVPDAVVHHKTLASHIRSEARIYHNLFTLLKGKLYFSLVNNHGHYPTARAVEDMRAYVTMQEAQLKSHVAAGRLEPAVLERFAEDVERAWRIGMARGEAKERQLAGWAAQPWREDTFLAFPRPRPVGGRVVTLLVRLTPDLDGLLQTRARALAVAGHHVHAVLPGKPHDRVDFEEGVWVYRFLTPLEAVRRVGARWKLDSVYVAQGDNAAEFVAELARELGRPAAHDSAPGWFRIQLTRVTGEAIAAE